MLNLNNIKDSLLNKEMSYTKLDNIMMSYDFYSNFNEGAVGDIKECRNTVYTYKDNETYIIIDFVIVEDNLSEVEEDFILKVIDIDYL